jgi:hypothetical protein
MDRLESQAYVSHRLRLAGASQAVFTPDALEALFHFSGGVPRLLNTVADNALFEAFLCEAKPVDSSIVAAAAVALGLVRTPLEAPSPSMPKRPEISASPVETHLPADWLEPVAPMPLDVPSWSPPRLQPAPVVMEDVSPVVEIAEGLEFELEELSAEPQAPLPIEVEIDFDIEPPYKAAAAPPDLEPEDSDWSLGAVIRDAEPLPGESRNRSDDSFNLRSLALEVDAEPEAPAAPTMSAEKDDDDLDALFDEIQRDD